MKTSAESAAGTSRRAQPVRQTRANPPRGSVPATRPFTGRQSTDAGTHEGVGGRTTSSGNANGARHLASPPGFFPAITHFTDSIAALPKEIVRHFTLLKEVDAKACGPEETLAQLTELAMRAPPPKPKRTDAEPADRPAGQAQAPVEESDMARRHLFLNLRFVLSEMLMTLDEKNHVISTANEALQKQLLRVDSSLPYIDNEISEEARLGSLTHWAYIDKGGGKAKAGGGATGTMERPRRDVAAANSLAAAAAALNEEAAASRSESRREAMLARKQRNQPADSDLDDVAGARGRQRDGGAGQASLAVHGSKKARAGSKNRKGADAGGGGGGGGGGPGSGNGGAVAIGNPPNKRRRTEKAAANGHAGQAAPMERSVSGVFGNGAAGVGKGNAGSPRETPAAEPPSRKRARGGAAASGAPPRKRHNTTSSAMRSPSVASSPVTAAFPLASKEVHRSSPAPGTAAQRPTSVRARKNSSQSVLQEQAGGGARHRPSSSASNKPQPANGASAGTPELKTAAVLTARSVPEVKATMKEAVNAKGEHQLEDVSKPGHAEMRGALVLNTGGRQREPAAERVMKREDTDAAGGAPTGAIRHTSVTTSTRKASKNSTPVTATFSDASKPARSRSARGGATSAAAAAAAAAAESTAKRSHKKGAGQAAAAQHVPGLASGAADAGKPDGGPSSRGEGAGQADDDDDDDDGSEPRYCYCNQVSYGEMVACDADDCEREWFHLDCVGLAKAPTKNGELVLDMWLRTHADRGGGTAKWYCDKCKENLRTGGGGGRGGKWSGNTSSR
ncbi:MAG: hypothetical protein M1832_003302 [Thelocarpon impressellum]|nr:MAG: hypothetical protein M1832_003302 [Thelocarpon impressellum]